MVVRNVFDFDRYQPELQEQIVTILQKHGIPLGADEDSIKISKRSVKAVLTLLYAVDCICFMCASTA